MIQAASLDSLKINNAWMTVGIFDGVHRGHQALLSSLVTGAQKKRSPAVVMTFDPHPAIVLGGKKDFRCLTTLKERLILLQASGVDAVIVQEFTNGFADQTAETFLQQASDALGLKKLVIGYDTALGRGRAGDAILLAAIGRQLGFSIQVIPPMQWRGSAISSTRIRELISSGNVHAAADALGHNYSLSGAVIHGDGRGKKINIPTANLLPDEGKVLPANGIYACRAWLGDPSLLEMDNACFAAAVNIGIRPTFTPNPVHPLLEAHLLDFDGDLYGKTIKLEFIQHLRPEEKFPSIQLLIDRIEQDIAQTRQIVNSLGDV